MLKENELEELSDDESFNSSDEDTEFSPEEVAEAERALWTLDQHEKLKLATLADVAPSSTSASAAPDPSTTSRSEAQENASSSGEEASEASTDASSLPPLPPSRVRSRRPRTASEPDKAFRPHHRELSEEELKRDLIIRSLSHEVNERLDTSARTEVLTEGLPDFLLDADGEDLGLLEAQRQVSATVGTRLLRLGIVGVPNAGKSELTNYLVGGKVSAVSPRPETTRLATLGAFTDGTTQVVLYDTPGMHGTHDHRSRSHAMRVAATWTNVADCDMLAYIVDGPKQLGEFATRHVTQLAQALGSPEGPGVPDWTRPPVILLMNKVDQLSRNRTRPLLQVAEELGRVCEFERVFFISAKHGDGMADLRRYLIRQAKPAEWDLPADTPTDQDWPELAAELVREKLYWNHKNELPYALHPVTVHFQEHADGRVQIDQEVLVRTQRVKVMVSGAQNERVMRIQRTVGAEMAHMLRRRVEVSLKVKVRKNAALPVELL